MARYDVKVNVTYFYEVEADSEEQAEKQGWMYEDYSHFAEVDEIRVTEIEDDEDDEFIGGDEDE